MSSDTWRRGAGVALGAAALALLLGACGGALPGTATPSPTGTAMSTPHATPRPVPTATPTLSATTDGTVVGRVRIGPLCPVEPCPAPTRDVYSSRRLVFTPTVGAPTSVGLGPDGGFRASLRPGTYQVTLADCQFLGCSRALPKTIRVEATMETALEIDIDTGIR